MASAMDILRERLARGEITAQQYDEAAARLGVQSAPVPPPTPTPPAPPPVAAKKKGRGWLWFWIIAVVIAIGGAGIYYYLAGGLTTRSITGIAGQSMSFVLTNDSDRAGDVVFWANINGLEVCHGVVAIEENSQTTVTAPCPQMIQGAFVLQTFWAEAYPEAAAKARRINVN